MPFVSKSQLRTCYGKNKKDWDCDEFLNETKSICSLPEKKGRKVRSRAKRKGEKIKGKVKTGPRGGRYFIIKEKDSKGIICTVKVYVDKDYKHTK